jgi:predicted nucleic acid-binding protein
VIVLDTNVISPLMTNEADSRIVAWLDSCPRETLWLTSISLFELRYGIEILAVGRQRRQLELGLARVFDMGFQDRILDLDKSAAAAAASIAAARRQRGRPTEIRDTLIAGIVTANRAEFATRNVRHFQDLDIRIIDPWAN